MYSKAPLRIRFLIEISTILIFLVLYFLVINLSPFLSSAKIGGGEVFYKNFIGSCVSFFIPINIISWLVFGQTGGVLVLLFSCLSIVFIVLRYGIFYYNSLIFLFGVSAFVGYRFFLNMNLFRNRCTAKLETLEVDKNTLLSNVSQKEKDTEVFENRVHRYTALKDITENLSSTLNLEDIARLVVEGSFNVISGSDRALLFLIDEAKQELGLFASRLVDELPFIKAKKGDIFDTWILKQRKPLIIEDMDNDFRFSPDGLKDSKDRDFKSIIGVPLMSEKRVIGILRMDSRKKAVYAQDDLRLLDIISDLAAVSIENSILYQKTNELAIKDGLTGLYVQRYFKEMLEIELKRSLSNKKKFSILMIDLDYFKDCNDKYGHTAGDILLGKIAQLLKAIVGAGHIVSRYGGEEFAILLLDIGKKEAIRISEDIRKNVEETIFTLRRHQVKITVSVGISLFPDDGYLAEALLKKADENLYKAKQSGRNKLWPTSI